MNQCLFRQRFYHGKSYRLDPGNTWPLGPAYHITTCHIARAMLAISGLFKPVEIEGLDIIDGGFTANISYRGTVGIGNEVRRMHHKTQSDPVQRIG